jgi:hypothetical protein
MYNYNTSRASREFIPSTITPINHRESQLIDEYQLYRASLAQEKYKPPEYKCFDWKYVKVAAIVFVVIVILGGIATGFAYLSLRDTVGYNGICFDSTSCKSSLNLDCLSMKCFCKTDYTWSGSTCKKAQNSG